MVELFYFEVSGKVQVYRTRQHQLYRSICNLIITKLKHKSHHVDGIRPAEWQVTIASDSDIVIRP